MAAIFAVLAGNVRADDLPPAAPADTTTTLTQPAATTTAPTDPPALPAVTIPVTPAPAPVVLPAPGQQVQVLLMKRIRTQLTGYIKTTHHWQSLLGQKPGHPVNIWALGSLQRAARVLETWKNRSHHLHIYAKRWMKQKIGFYKQQIQHWSIVMGAAPPRQVRALASSESIELRFNRTRKQYDKTMARVRKVPYEPQLMCIHGGEGSWTDPNYPFWGGLQMNMGFQATYGGYLLRTKGTANNWTPLEQMWVAAKAIRSGRGFYPWPNTARACGLIS